MLFDCDGVLVDSEPITNGVLRDMLEELGWTLTQAECMRIFVGKAVKDEAALIEPAHRPPAHAPSGCTASRRAATRRWTATCVGHPRRAGGGARRCTRRWTGASPAPRAPTAARSSCSWTRSACCDSFEGRIFSGHETPRSKPAPDVYLAAAAALGVDPARCAVVEDTVTGATAGVAAGATVFGYSPGGLGHSGAEALRAAGVAHIFTDMAELPAVLAAWR